MVWNSRGLRRTGIREFCLGFGLSRSVILLGLGLAPTFALPPAYAVDASTNCVASALWDEIAARVPPPTLEKLSTEIASRRARVPEFVFIRELAEKMGLRVWLHGGTASSYAHYVKEDLLREAGDPRYIVPDGGVHRFDYDYTNIYRSTQDLDIVVDGDAKQAEVFEQALKQQFPYFLGDKANKWEVKSLRQARRAGHYALLDDLGFKNQHTDSNSTGMIELTDPFQGMAQGVGTQESIIRDLRDWSTQGASQFLKDVKEGKLHFYFSPTHATTPRAKAGLNPPIFAVIRYWTKAFYYGLETRGASFFLVEIAA